MIVALLIGREGSTGFPGKNTISILGLPMMVYPLLAAKEAKAVDRIYVSTDSPKIKELAVEYGAQIIERPAELCTSKALGEDVFVHGYKTISELVKKEGGHIELIVLLHCNSPTILPETIDEGIRVLREHIDYDSAVTVSKYNMWSPLRARKIGADGLLHPFIPFEIFGDPKTLNCDRDSQGDVVFADMAVSIVRPACLDNIHHGLLPQKWMGQKIYPLIQVAGLDVDYEWQLPQAEFWLKMNALHGKEITPKRNLDSLVRVESMSGTRQGYLRLDKNENTIGFDDAFIEKICQSITSDLITSYPEVHTVYDKLAKWLHVDGNMIYVTAGSEAGIKSAFEAFVDEGDEVVLLDPTYAMYYVFAEMFGARLKKVKFDGNLQLERGAVIQAITDRTRLICLANPNSPTGTILEEEELLSIIKYAEERKIPVLIDEAYYFFYHGTLLDKVGKFTNLLITRSFTKALGLGSARFGYVVSNPHIISILKKFKPMYEVNSFAVLLASAVIDNPKLVEDHMKQFEEGKQLLCKSLDDMNLKYFKSYANFLLVDVGGIDQAVRIEKLFAERKILIRAGFKHHPFNRCIRIGIGTRDQMVQVIQNLKEILAYIGK